MTEHRAGRLLAVLSAALLTTITAVGAAGAATRTAPGVHDYVALGDSYTAGPFIPWQRLDPLGCFRSNHDYPSLLAEQLHVDRFADASCSGATTANMTEPQDVTLGPNAPQLDALTEHTDLVTLGIGGNDFSVFGTLVGECVELAKDDPQGNPCQAKDGAKLAAAMPKIQQRVAGVLAGIHRRAPEAKVLVVGYPSIVPEHGTCPALPLARGDYPWARQVEMSLNGALQDAVAADGAASFVDTFTPSTGHDICGSGGEPWINGKDLNLFAALSYHPFRSAMTAEAGFIDEALGGAPSAKLTRPYPVHAGLATHQQLERAAH